MAEFGRKFGEIQIPIPDPQGGQAGELDHPSPPPPHSKISLPTPCPHGHTPLPMNQTRNKDSTKQVLDVAVLSTAPFAGMPWPCSSVDSAESPFLPSAYAVSPPAPSKKIQRQRACQPQNSQCLLPGLEFFKGTLSLHTSPKHPFRRFVDTWVHARVCMCGLCTCPQ